MRAKATSSDARVACEEHEADATPRTQEPKFVDSSGTSDDRDRRCCRKTTFVVRNQRRLSRPVAV